MSSRKLPTFRDRIEGDRIIIYDNSGQGSKILKTVEIVRPSGEKRTYVIRKTEKGGYLFN